MSRIEHIKAHPAYQQLSAERLRLGLCLSAVMAGAYFVFILTVAFRPQVLGTPLGENTVMTWGLLAGVSVITLGFLLTAFYVVWANSRFDTLSEQLEEDVR